MTVDTQYLINALMILGAALLLEVLFQPHVMERIDKLGGYKRPEPYDSPRLKKIKVQCRWLMLGAAAVMAGLAFAPDTWRP